MRVLMPLRPRSCKVLDPIITMSTDPMVSAKRVTREIPIVSIVSPIGTIGHGPPLALAARLNFDQPTAVAKVSPPATNVPPPRRSSRAD